MKLSLLISSKHNWILEMILCIIETSNYELEEKAKQFRNLNTGSSSFYSVLILLRSTFGRSPMLNWHIMTI